MHISTSLGILCGLMHCVLSLCLESLGLDYLVEEDSGYKCFPSKINSEEHLQSPVFITTL